MSRLFSIIVTLFILVLVYLWIGHISDRKAMAAEPREATPSAVERESAGETYAEVTESEGHDESADSVDIPVEEEETEEQEPEVKDPESSAKGGSHLVIVGNFLERANAEKHLSTVKNLGYPDSEILQFEISQYYTVCAGRYNDPTEARRLAKKIKEQHGIDAYMRTVN